MFQADVRQPPNRATAGASAVRMALPSISRDGGESSTSSPAIPSISLHKGGGAIRGMGEKFAANPVTGTGSMTVPIATSPGRSGFGPQLALSYDSGAGNGPFGFGWSLALPSITRKTDKGLPQYNDAAESDEYILSGAEDLAPLLVKVGEAWKPAEPLLRTVGSETYSIKRYRPRIEGLFARIEKWTNQKQPEDTFWRSISKDNITTWCGKSENSRIADPADPTHIFSWLICESYDDKGNVIVYQYKDEDSQLIDATQAHERNRTANTRSANRYLKRIRYGNRKSYLPKLLAGEPWPSPADATESGGSKEWFFEVIFDYGEHDLTNPKPQDAGAWPVRNDPFSVYRAGFDVRIYRLCQRVLMFHHFLNEADVGADCLVRSTDFTYAYEQNADSVRDPVFSFLHAVTQTGYVRQSAGDYRKKSLPPLLFEYSKVPTPAELAQLPVQTVDSTSLENLPVGLDGATYQWVDLDGEGISGILTEQADGWFYKRNLSPKPADGENGSQSVTARFGPLELVATKPAASLAGHAQFLDLAGDGQVDLVQMDGPVRGFYERTAEAGWVTFRPFVAWPNVDTRDPNFKFVDLDGDGHADILIAEDDVFTWHASLAEAGFGPAKQVTQPLDEEKGPRLLFADGTQSIYLTDMSGDGLTDLARIRNGEICYWPNLGYGRFGAKVTMDNAPWFDQPDQFNQQRIRLADVDGSGTTDILYLGRNRVNLYRNQSGNGWGGAEAIPFPQVDNLASVMALDLLGNGTACLVWSSPLPSAAGCPMRYIDLMNGGKPHLLVRAVNNLGAETRVAYAPSTKFYLQDKFAGKPWITRLPFPVHVVERVESDDHISRNRFVTRYAYHHGYFDGDEREFRGFGMVEQWDTEEIGKLLPEGTPPTAANLEQASFVPPVLTKSWFHTGVYVGREHISDFFAGMGKGDGEYYREPALRGDDSHDPAAGALLLPDTVLPAGLTVEEEREACRALKGSMLRQEVYAWDGTPAAEHPYTVTEQNFTVRRVQPRSDNRHGVFFPHPREVITYHYERNPADPRISHALTLEVDDYGNVLQSVSIGYGRRKDSTDPKFSDEDRKKQRLIHMTCTENLFTKPSGAKGDAANSAKSSAVDEDDVYRVPLPAEAYTYELRKPEQEVNTDGQQHLFHFDDIAAKVTQAGDGEHDIPYEDLKFAKAQEAAKAAEDEKNRYFRRLIEHVRTFYRPNDLGVAQNNPLTLLPLGRIESMAIPGESYKLAFTPELLTQRFQRAGAPLIDNTADLLGGVGPDQGGYVDLDGDGHWWIPAGRMFYSPEPDDDAAQELSEARAHFFLPRRFCDPFGSTTIVDYDGLAALDQPRYDLLVTRTADALNNQVRAENNYRVLQPQLVTDPNGNRTQVVFDALGLVVGTAVMGKVGEEQGDLLDATFAADLTQAQIAEFYNADDPHLLTPGLLQKATTRIVYDLDCFRRSSEEQPDAPDQWRPPYAATLARKTHHFDPVPPNGLKIQISFSYSDGFGREIQKKIQAEPGPAPLRDHAGKMITNADGQPEMTTTDVTPRWVGSGWTIFNNKGKPVRQYEPFFTDTHRFEFDAQIGVSPVLFYDPVERVVATLHPNHTYEKVVFDPWQQRTWDVNDTIQLPAAPSDPPFDPKNDPDVGQYFGRLASDAYLPTWYDCRTDAAKALVAWPDHDEWGQPLPANARRRAAERQAAEKAAPHAATPTVAHFDTLGRPFLTLADNGPDPADPERHLYFATRVELDIEGNQRAVIDANGRVVMRYDYDMLGNRIHQASMEAGERWTLNDVTGQPIRAWDSRGHSFTTTYDALRRPLGQTVHGTTAESDPRTRNRNILVDQIEYGEGIANAEAHNLRTRVYRHCDSAGVATNARLDANGNPTAAYDFKGNVLHSTRQLVSDYKAIPDWRLSPQLDAEHFTSSTRYDALNRPIQSIAPHSSLGRGQINVIQPVFNEANLLERVDVWLERTNEPTVLLDRDNEAPSPVGVADIDYDAKGQRTLIDYKTADATVIRTTYAYDRATFRLTHLYTRRGVEPTTAQGVAFTDDCENSNPPPATLAAPAQPPAGKGCGLQNLRYTYDPAGNITHIRDDAQQIIYFSNRRVEPSNDYTYDALYRLIQASGREHLGQNGPIPHSYNDAGRVGIVSADASGRFAPNDKNAMGTYTERYVYDAVGNFLQMQHWGDNPANPGWTRRYTYNETSLLEADKMSNRLSSTQVGNGVVFAPEPYAHDVHGNMTSMPHLQQMLWDYKDQLRLTQRQKINDEDADGVARHGERTWYSYDAAGQRVRKVTELANNGGRKEERIYLGGFEIYRAYSGPANARTVKLERETLHIMDDKQRIALVETRTLDTTGSDQAPRQLIRYQFGNHLGSASLELNEQAQIISYEEYAPYGSTTYQAVRNQTETPKRYRFIGKERDEENGFYYCRARYYLLSIARWLSTDPSKMADGPNTYGFVNQNPVRLRDPSGLAGEETNVVTPTVLEALKQKGLPYATEVTFDLLNNVGEVVTSGRFDVVTIDPRTGELIVPELKGKNLGSLTPNQRTYVPVLETAEGGLVRITGQKSGSLGLAPGATVNVNADKFVRVGMENLNDFREALQEVAGGARVKHTFLESSGKVRMFTTTEAFHEFLKQTGRESLLLLEQKANVAAPKAGNPHKGGGAPKGFVTLELLGIGLGTAVAGMQFLQGGKEIAAGKTGEGAVSTAEGSTTLFMTFAPYAEGVTVGSGGAAIAGALGAGALASGAIMLASNEARAAISGEKTAAVQAAEYYAGLAVEGEAEGGVKGVLKQTAGWTGGFFSTLIAVGQGY